MILRLETAAMRATIALVRRGLRDVYLPGQEALEPHQRDVVRVLESLDDIEIALVRLDVALDRRSNSDVPF
jgi:hypothetical protein